MAIQKIEVGEMPNKLFMLMVIDLVNGLVKKTNGDDGWKLSISSPAENEVEVCHICQGDEDTVCDQILQILISYKFNHIYIDGKWGVEYNRLVRREQKEVIENGTAKLLDFWVEVYLERISKLIMKGLMEYVNMIDVFPYVFNDITCLNTNTGKVETIRLSPYFDILTPARLETYDAAIDYGGTHCIIYHEERNQCVAKSLNKNDYGNIYTLSATKIAELKPTGQKTIWIPMPAIEQMTSLPLNKILVLKDADNADSAYDYMYLSTKGIFYNGEVIASTLSLKDDAILYVDTDKSFAVCVLESGKVSIACMSGEAKTGKEYNIEAVVDRSEINTIASLQPFASQLAALSDTAICDGTKFEPFNCHDEEESGNEASLGFNLGKLVEIIRKYWKIILGIIALLLFLLI